MFGLGFPEMLLIFVIALIVFGPKKLPELGKSIGRAMAEFKKAQQEFQESVQAEMREVEKTAELDKLKELGKIEIPDYGKTEVTSVPEAKPEEQQATEHKAETTSTDKTGSPEIKEGETTKNG